MTGRETIALRVTQIGGTPCVDDFHRDLARPATWVLRAWCRNAATVRIRLWIKVKNRKHPAMARVMESV
jgi:hypothetical protein